MDSFVDLLVAGIFLILGISIRLLKASFLIAGFNTMSKNEKEKIDTGKLNKYVGNMNFILAAVFFIVWLIGDVMGFIGRENVYVRIIPLIIVILSGLIFINTGKRIYK